MSVAATCGWTFARCVVVLVFGLPAAWLIRRLLQTLPRPQARIAWGLLLLAAVSPELMTGYAYASFGWSLGAASPRVEVFYALLLIVRCVPLGAIVWYFTPAPPLSAAARFSSQLLRQGGHPPRGTVIARLKEWLSGPAASALPAAGVMFLIAFQEFELASRLGATSWTVSMFDAHIAAPSLTESLRLSLVPLVIEAIVLLPLLGIITQQRTAIEADELPDRFSPTWRWFGWLLAVGCAVAIFLIPLARISVDLPAGFRQLLRDRIQRRELLREILQSLGLALATGVSSYLLAGCVLAMRGRLRVILASLLSLPGLCGSLIVGLIVLQIFHWEVFHSLYNTLVPVALALIVVLFPRALLLRLLLSSAESNEGWHMARLLRGSADAGQRFSGTQIGWEVRERNRYWCMALLCHWGYWELPASALLSPSWMVPAPVQLYNFMHGHHGAVLSAMLAATIGIPLLLFVVLARARRLIWRWCGR